MTRSAWSWGALCGSLVVLGGACTSKSAEHDNFAGGKAELALLAAPPGLCEGAGDKKECSDPAGCGLPSGPSGDPGVQNAGPGAGGGAGSDSNGSGSGGEATSGGEAPPVDTDSPTCAIEPDASVPFDCDAPDAGASLSRLATAQIESDVPTCGSLDQQRAAKLYMSADDSSSLASPVIARRLLRDGQLVPAHVLRPHEFLNYYDTGFAPAPKGEVALSAQLSACPSDGQLSLQVVLRSEARAAEDRKPLTLTFVLDTSGSMSGEPMELEREAVRVMATQLRRGDIVSMVTWSSDQQDILTGHEVTGPDDETLLNAVAGLEANGGTDLHAGLVRGYELAQASFARDRINRVILISDGGANLGVTDAELIGKFADDEEGQEGIYLAGIGVGSGVDDTLMNAVTDVGRGAYVYLDSPEEAQKMLGASFLQVVDLAARAVRLELELPWYLTIEKFYGEIVSTDASKVRPQHLSPNDQMVFFQTLRACDAAQLHGDDRIRLRATWETPFTRNPQQAVIDTTLNELAGDDAVLRRAAAVAGYADALSLAASAPDDPETSLATERALENVRAANPGGADPALNEIESLLVLLRDALLAYTAGGDGSPGLQAVAE